MDITVKFTAEEFLLIKEVLRDNAAAQAIRADRLMGAVLADSDPHLGYNPNHALSLAHKQHGEAMTVLFDRLVTGY